MKVQASSPELEFAAVAVGRPVRGGSFTYSVPAEMSAELVPGVRVRVPFGRGNALGFFMGAAPRPASQESLVRVKPLLQVLDAEPALPPDVLALLRFASEHYRYPLGETLRSALPPGLSQPHEERPPAPQVQLFAEALPGADPKGLKRAPAQAAALSYLMAVGGRAEVEEVTAAIPGAKEALKKLVHRGWVRLDATPLEAGVRAGLGQSRPSVATPEQASALETLLPALDSGSFQPFLLHGVTGSGKTEVYLRCVEHLVEQGRGSLILVPEIALTPQLVGRFQSRFGTQVAVLHSGLKDRERHLQWRALRAGNVRIAVGVRSAIFAPVERLGLIVVDEEHDPSFKQEEKLRYQARDLAVVRAKQLGAMVLLGSATPSLETVENARKGRYRKLSMKARVDDRPLPTVELVDLREHRPRSYLPEEESPILAPAVSGAIEHVLARGQQAILFLNRRGHSTFLLCATCGLPVRCAHCDVSLTHHLNSNKAMCHYCGEQRAVPLDCPSCHGPLLRLGVGTEKVEAEVAERFPKARVARLDRDSATSSEKVTELLASFARRELDVLVGTQMVAKGHDFPGVTLVCVVMADTSLMVPDFRAAERTFQLLTQVAGRAGRGADAGRVLIQTYNPMADAIQRVLSHDFEGFIEQELAWRQAMAYPPFTRLAGVRVDAVDPHQAREAAEEIGRWLEAKMPPARAGVRLLGPAPANVARVRGRTRWQLLLKGPSHATLTPLLRELELRIPELPKSVRVVLDVDPGGML